jgi:hypothetical protein
VQDARDSAAAGRPAGAPAGAPSAPASGSTEGARAARPQAATGQGAGIATLWYLGTEGDLRTARVRTGLSDGTQTVIVDAPDEVQEGLSVIAAVTTGSTQTTTAANPFQTQQATGGRGGPPGGF